MHSVKRKKAATIITYTTSSNPSKQTPGHIDILIQINTYISDIIQSLSKLTKAANQLSTLTHINASMLAASQLYENQTVFQEGFFCDYKIFPSSKKTSQQTILKNPLYISICFMIYNLLTNRLTKGWAHTLFDDIDNDIQLMFNTKPLEVQNASSTGQIRHKEDTNPRPSKKTIKTSYEPTVRNHLSSQYVKATSTPYPFIHYTFYNGPNSLQHALGLCIKLIKLLKQPLISKNYAIPSSHMKHITETVKNIKNDILSTVQAEIKPSNTVFEQIDHELFCLFQQSLTWSLLKKPDNPHEFHRLFSELPHINAVLTTEKQNHQLQLALPLITTPNPLHTHSVTPRTSKTLHPHHELEHAFLSCGC